MNKTVFISYSWAEPSSGIVNNWLTGCLKGATIDYSVDKQDCQYHDSIAEFERKIGNADMIIAVISRSFLESIHCMYEMASVFEKGGDIARRLFVIGIEEIQKEDEIRHYWKDEYDEAKYRFETEEFAVEPIEKKYNQTDLIRKHLGKFLVYLGDRNGMNFSIVSANNYSAVLKQLQNRINEAEIPVGDLMD